METTTTITTTTMNAKAKQNYLELARFYQKCGLTAWANQLFALAGVKQEAAS